MHTQVLEWLKAGNDDAEDIVDLPPWNVRQVERTTTLPSIRRYRFS